MIFRTYDLRRDRLPRRIVHDGAQSEDKGEQQQHPGRDVMVEREHAKDSSRDYHPTLRDQ